MARESVVLLKNSGGLLPLQSKGLKAVTVVGALADVVLPDFYGGVPPYAVTPLAAIKSRLGTGVTVTYVGDNKDGAAAAAVTSCRCRPGPASCLRLGPSSDA